MTQRLFDGYTKRRDQLSIIATILDKAQGGARKTQIMYAANLSFTQLNEYITFLLDQGLIRLHKMDKKGIYITTGRGVLFVQMYSDLLDMIKFQSKANKRIPFATNSFKAL